MCNLCEALVKCDKHHKAKVIINPERTYKDPFGMVWVDEPVYMEVNHDEDTLEPYAFIFGGAAHRKETDGVSYGNKGFDIRFCPFCGEKLY